jgi:protein-tyrosine phosphatase
MIDFHSHILPYIDDGAKSFDMSLDMLRLSQDEGVRYICATSHYIPGEIELSLKDYIVKLNNLRHLCQLKDIEINLVPALEIYMSLELPRLYKEKKIWGINDSKYLLIEFPMQTVPLYAEEVLYELRLEGAIPVIAHPERNFAIMKDENILINFLNQGILAQVNAGSLRGIYGKDIKSFAEHLVSRNMVHLLGSDGHNDRERSTTIGGGREAIRNLNKELYDWMDKNQYNIIEGKNVEPLEVRPDKKKFDFGRLFK